jgi:hypothetical protein
MAFSYECLVMYNAKSPARDLVGAFVMPLFGTSFRHRKAWYKLLWRCLHVLQAAIQL